MLNSNHSTSSFVVLTLLACLNCVSTGCTGQATGPPTYRVQGTVEFEGAPIPRGRVIFSPDSSQGNKGSQGVSEIKDGRFDTSTSRGRNALGGPQIVKVLGFDGKTFTDDAGIEAEDGRLLFPAWETTIDIKEEIQDLNLVVPTSPAK
ncbi:hypothetical protein EC9_32890 [Rosistilla ulvae]|uniref:Carboxypeptidase regulatory-like domain-containing protein n=1 Tax=Rosistilla ulvae TaxID=1930277 RepID=A0A517M2J6_9BACT|nr:hypothetical protein [Rosistilla ulvae]QDS89092.1 hypothetical protein EC9_32890 [Rosistilla ulvae]